MGNLCCRRSPPITVTNVVNNYYGVAAVVEEVVNAPAVIVEPAAAVVVENEFDAVDSWDRRLVLIIRRDRATAAWGLLFRAAFHLVAALRRRRSRRWAVLGHHLRDLKKAEDRNIVVTIRRAARIAILRRRWASLGGLLQQ